MSDLVYKKIKLLERMLQKNVVFNIGTKTIRRGRLLLFNIDEYYIKFTIKTNKNVIKTYDAPYPYDIEVGDNSIKLSYKLETFCRGNVKKEEFLREQLPVGNNKLYDTKLIITNIDPMVNK
tara:strand:- start:8267 stop:8629 length:363 start_codon:yes stop_codon:yes gene_type:complete